MTTPLNLNNFFENYIINTQSTDLNKEDRLKALIYSIALGIFTAGLVHLFVALKVHVFTKKSGEETEGDKKINEVASRKLSSNRLQDAPLEEISKMTEEEIEKLCQSIKVENRDDYKKCMLIYAIKGQMFSDIDMELHSMIAHFQDENGELKQFVHEDIAEGRNNKEDTLLHEILKCKFLSAKSKGSVFNFIIREGHDYLRDYIGDRTLGEANNWGVRPTTFSTVKWGNSIKIIFDNFSEEDKKDFFETCVDEDRLNSFTEIKKPQN